MTPLLCVHVPVFRLALARRDRSDIALLEPAVLADKPDRGRIIEVEPAAYALGARPGHTVLQARAAAGNVHVLVHDRERSRMVWNDMLDALDAVSPLVDDCGEGTAYLHMRGIEGSASQWTARAADALSGFDLPVRTAVGPNKFVARARTYAGTQPLESLRIEVLELEQRIVERLHLLGVRTLHDLVKLPHGPFVRRFGKEAARWHDCARGIDPTPFRPRAHELQIDATAYGEGSAEQEEQIVFALRVLADRVCNDLQRAGKAAGTVCLTFECDNGEVRVVESGFAQPTGDARTMLNVIRAKLETVTFDAPVTGLRLQVMRLEECGAAAALFGGQNADPHALTVALARLQAATGNTPARASTRPASLLERRFTYQPFTVQQKPFAATERVSVMPAAPPQLRLLAVREIEVRVRGNAPAKVRGKRVVDCAGPWRVEESWFNEPVRDEYDVLLEDGALCRIYRQASRWYLRGLYD